MDMPLGPEKQLFTSVGRLGLNPCFNGYASRTLNEAAEKGIFTTVLILVLMDMPLGQFFEQLIENWKEVLILVLMDMPLGLSFKKLVFGNVGVLILVLMDMPLGHYVNICYQNLLMGLNPCFNGYASRTYALPAFGYSVEQS